MSDNTQGSAPLYQKQTWIDHLVADDTGEVLQEGSVLEAARFNHMEEGIETVADLLADVIITVTDDIQPVLSPIKDAGYVKDVDYDVTGKRIIFKKSNGQKVVIPIKGDSYKVSYYDGASLLFTDVVEEGKNSSLTMIPSRDATAQYTYTFIGWSSNPNATAAEEGCQNNITASKALYAVYSKTVPSRDATAQYTYTFIGWSSNPNATAAEEGCQNNITASKALYAVYSKTVRSYVITFANNGQTLHASTLDYGATPSYDGSALTNADGRPFDKWVPAITSVTGPATYSAAFKHKITYMSGDTVLSTEYVSDGGTPASAPTPTKSSTAQYNYTFTGWTTVSGSSAVESDALSAMEGDRTVYAVFTENLRSYTVKFSVNGEVSQASYYYGQTPAAPTNILAVDGREFSCWDQEISPVNADITYTALYQKRVRFYDGSNLLKTVYVHHGQNAVYGDDAPTKASTAQYFYEFAGWSTTSGGATDANILNAVTADKDVYAVFTAEVRTYVIYFRDRDGSLLQTVNAAYGSTPAYSGDNPTHPSGYAFAGWSPSLSSVTGSKTYYAKFAYPAAWTETITDSWEQILEACEADTYKTKYSLGATKIADFGDEGLTRMHLVGFDCDEKTSGGYAKMSWVPEHCLKTTWKWNNSNDNSGGYASSQLKTRIDSLLTKLPKSLQDGIVVPEHCLKTTWKWNNSNDNSGGYASSQLKTRIDSLLTKLPKSLQDGIVKVKKSCRLYGNSDQSVNVKLWAPSYREYYGSDSNHERSGPIYTNPPKPAKMTGSSPDGSATSVNVKLWAPSYREYYGSDSNHERSGPIYTNPPKPAKMTGSSPDGSATDSWLRTANYIDSSYALYVSTYGVAYNSGCSVARGALPGFCIDL